MRRSIGPAVIAIALMVLALGFAAAAAAQSDAVRAIYQSSASSPTNIAGVRTYAAPPAGFSPLSASDEALASYGFPPRPDKQADADGYAKWARAMAGAKTQWIGTITPHPEFQTGVMRPVTNGSAAAAVVPATSATPTSVGSENWSGIVNTNTLTAFNKNSSFGTVTSIFHVPIAQEAFVASGSPGNICDNFFDIEATWAGIDGAFNGDVLQGGSFSDVVCSTSTGRARPGYFAWVEWFPSYPVLEVFPVNPGDDMYVITMNTTGPTGCNPGNVFVEDITQQVYGTFQLAWLTGPCLVGSSAEFIVERPAGDPFTPTDLYPLANYILQFSGSESENLRGAPFYPGSQQPSTFLVIMFDDTGTIPISVPFQAGQATIVDEDENCAYVGGCSGGVEGDIQP